MLQQHSPRCTPPRTQKHSVLRRGRLTHGRSWDWRRLRCSLQAASLLPRALYGAVVLPKLQPASKERSIHAQFCKLCWHMTGIQMST